MTKINSIKTSNGSVHKIDEGIGFPSSKYVDLEWEGFVSESNNMEYSFIAPENGYTTIEVNWTASNGWVNIIDADIRLATTAAGIPGTHRIFLPCSKGHTIVCSAGYVKAIKIFRFIYAQGSEPEE